MKNPKPKLKELTEKQYYSMRSFIQRHLYEEAYGLRITKIEELEHELESCCEEDESAIKKCIADCRNDLTLTPIVLIEDCRNNDSYSKADKALADFLVSPLFS
jgi:hypothetical protein